MAQWYSLEGLAARVGLESQAVSVVREGFKRAFGNALAVMGRGGEVNDHFDGVGEPEEVLRNFYQRWQRTGLRRRSRQSGPQWSG